MISISLSQKFQYMFRLIGGTAMLALLHTPLLEAADTSKSAAAEKRSEIFTGKGDPARTLGRSGDLYLDLGAEDDVVLYRKSAKGQWQKTGKFLFERESTEQRQTCPAGQYVIGLEANSKIVCGATVGGGHSKTCSGHGTLLDNSCQCQSGWRGSECDEQVKQTIDDIAPNKDKDDDGSSVPDDCNDSDDAVYPGAPEVTDGKDNNCNGTVDEPQL